MASPLHRFSLGATPELEISLQLMERKIDGLMTTRLGDGSIVPADGLRWDVPDHPDGAQSTDLRWDFAERSRLLQATRYLTFPRTIGHGTLMVARALGSDKHEPRERLYGIRTQVTALEWYADSRTTEEDIVCTRLGIEWRGDVRKVAAGLLECLNRARPVEENVPDVGTERYTGIVGTGGRVVVPPRRNGRAVLDGFSKTT